MTGFLASVRSAEEAEIVLAGGADVIDLKDPDAGALGALPGATIRAAVARVAGRRPVSATTGDRPLDDPADLTDAVARIAETGVDFVKVGLFPGRAVEACLDALAMETRRVRLVAVMLADLEPDFARIAGLAERGFAGVMLDTAGKRGGTLCRHLDRAALEDFVVRCRRCGLLCGLAGGLAADDLPALLPLEPDYLGFRGALTAGTRGDSLDPATVRAIRAAIPRSAMPWAAQPAAAASRASAAAGAQPAARSATSAFAWTSPAKST